LRPLVPPSPLDDPDRLWRGIGFIGFAFVLRPLFFLKIFLFFGRVGPQNGKYRPAVCRFFGLPDLSSLFFEGLLFFPPVLSLPVNLELRHVRHFFSLVTEAPLLFFFFFLIQSLVSQRRRLEFSPPLGLFYWLQPSWAAFVLKNPLSALKRRGKFTA